MALLRFLLCLFAFVGALAAAGTLVVSIMLMLRFPPLLVAVLLACWILNRPLKVLSASIQSNPSKNTAT
ncbi:MULTISPECIES: hypothetical protein [Pseudomonas]|jgi:hypothetical protein|uniref:Uncharacterized protein n=1 Tax=Pseudomonas extremaustralis TaxID=359110 RepID=A0A5C5QES0_9PSED|nr:MULTISPECIES: hypothetical protein [Pseudomonas]EZI30346.1 hypothetical protein PE143B_0100400 [Pseudomonas extremaustralis 14-3 substr. 14-3b]TWS03815.1 hypothetical protein FIV36_14880 [Pseudomonas extremaustralis]SDG24378.1 hypothetical protein SAMN05216591_5386 [Pseudomonas extremaustralis]